MRKNGRRCLPGRTLGCRKSPQKRNAFQTNCPPTSRRLWSQRASQLQPLAARLGRVEHKTAERGAAARVVLLRYATLACQSTTIEVLASCLFWSHGLLEGTSLLPWEWVLSQIPIIPIK